MVLIDHNIESIQLIGVGDDYSQGIYHLGLDTIKTKRYIAVQYPVDLHLVVIHFLHRKL